MDEREVRRVVRGAAESVYGVSAVVGAGWLDRLRASLGMGDSGVTVATDQGLAVVVDLRVAPTVPQGQVAANVAEAVRYVVERDLATHIDKLIVRVDGQPMATDQPPTPDQPAATETTNP